MSSVTRNGITFKDLKQGSKGRWSVQGGREYTVKVMALTSGAHIGPQQVLTSTGVRFGDFYRWPICGLATEWDYGSFVNTIDLEPDAKDSKQWVITLEYKPFDVNHEGGSNDNVSYDGKVNPFTIPPQVTWGSNKVERNWPYDYTTSGSPSYTPQPKPYVNAAGDPLEDPPKTEDSNPVVTIVRYEKFYDPNIVSLYKNHTNLGVWLNAGTLPGLSDVFVGYPDNTMKCGEISAKRVYDPDWGVYWEVTYEFEYRPQTWTAKVLNAGLRSLQSGKLKQIVAADGSAVSSAVCLATDGTYDPTSPPTPNFLSFQPYPQVDFTGLNIPYTIFISGPTA